MREKLHLPKLLDGALWFHQRSSYDVPMHRHSELEVNLAVRGNARYILGDRRFDLRPGAMIWLFPSQEHVLVDRSPDYQMWIGVFRVRLVRRTCATDATATLRKSDPHGFFCRQLSPEQTSRIARLYAEIAEKQAEPATFNAGLAWLLLSSWAEYQSATSHASGKGVHPAVEQAARLMRDESQTISLDEIADRCGLSPARLSRLFKRETGVKLVHYRQRQCLERLTALMSSGKKMTILDAAYAAGFGSYPQFHRVFRQLMGVTPRAYFVARFASR